MNTNIICHVLIHDESGNFLITRRSENESVLSGYWDIPGGSLEGRESPVDCVNREAQEESGLEVENPNLAFHTSNIDESKGERFVRLIFIARAGNTSVSISEEHDKFEWVTPEEAQSDFQLVDYLEDCFESIKNKSHNLNYLDALN